LNAVEIEQAISQLASQPFDATEFPFAFLAAFGNKETTIKRLRKGESNASDLLGGVLQRNNIHIATCESGRVDETLKALRQSPKTAAAKSRFILATDGETLEAEDLTSGETVASVYADFAKHFGFFLPLAGISTIKEIKDNPIDVRATGRLNKLYVELLKENPVWATEARRHDMNHFMARLIFCFFAEDTDIFNGVGLFTRTVEQMSERDSSNTHEVISTLFHAMNVKIADRAAANLPAWADTFPYVNGGLFSGKSDVPRFTRMARTYLQHAGELSWREINPDIFGSMIQAVAEEDERGALGLHYTSVPNILKVLNPLFLDDLHAQLEGAGDNPRMLLNLRRRMARIRVFDPACGSGNFLVIAYKEMRKIEAEVNRRRGEELYASEIPIENFRGIELRDFPAEIARLALVIAQFQCDVLYRGPLVARAAFLPLKKENWIIRGNALRLDWLSICHPTGNTVKLVADDLFSTPLDQAQIDFANEGGETYICGNPPYLGFTYQSAEQKGDIRNLLEGRTGSSGFLDYVAGWFIKAVDYGTRTSSVAAFVSTNSICQGQSVSILWPVIFDAGVDIRFAYTSFKWSNLASNKAGVTVAIVGIGSPTNALRRLYVHDEQNSVLVREGASITPYLTLGPRIIVQKRDEPLGALSVMEFGNKPSDGGHLLLRPEELPSLGLDIIQRNKFIRRIYGSDEFINGSSRFCIWIEDRDLEEAQAIDSLKDRIEAVRQVRLASQDKGANALAKRAHQLKLMRIGAQYSIVVPAITSENRAYLPCGILDNRATVTNKVFALYDAPLWNMAVIVSRLHWVWVGTVCVRLEMRFSYSNTLGWNTFPVPMLTEQNKADLTRCAENILLAREAHFPATIADLYEPETMPENLRHAHEQNDEVLERIYIGRRFRNDTERLEKLFEMYTKMTGAQSPAKKTTRKKAQ
jgi:hypothetical protein